MKQQLLPTVQIEKKLKEYRLSGMVQTLEMWIKQATEDNLGYAEFLGLLLEDETNKRSDLGWRAPAAGQRRDRVRRTIRWPADLRGLVGNHKWNARNVHHERGANR